MTKLIFYIILTFFSFSLLAEEETQTQEIYIRNNRFYPHDISLLAEKKIELIIHNEDDTVEEFESFDLRREKLIAAKSTKKIKIGPLKEGDYKFFGEFHESTAQGVIHIMSK